MKVLIKLRRAFDKFRHNDTAGAKLLLAATVVAILWANSGGDSYDHFWHTTFSLQFGDAALSMTLQHWINDGLMMLFFFQVSLEVKHDFVMGELHEWRRASVPVIAAVMGLLLPALLFVSLNAGGPAAGAWGVVISTDTAFVIGLLAVFGSTLPTQLRAFLITLAVVDDVGALLVIAFAYTEQINFTPLLAVAVVAAMLFVAQRLRLHQTSIYILAGAALWLAFLASGIHATIAGVVLGLLLPVFPPKRSEVVRAEELTRKFRRTPVAKTGRAAVDGIRRSVSINERLQLALEPIITLLVVPVFALSNAGVEISAETLGQAFTSPLTWGIILGLVVGKYLGVIGGTLLATRLRIGELAPGIGLRHVNSGGILTGIGFTISLFIIDLAISDPGLQSQARIGVLSASLIAAGLGMAALWLTARYDSKRAPARKSLKQPIDPKRDHVYPLGHRKRLLTLVEYGRFGGLDDYSNAQVVRKVIEHFGDEIQYVYRHNTLGDEMAEMAALAAEAVNAQSPRLFHPMRTELNRLSIDEELDLQQLRRAAVDVGANLPRMEEDIRRHTYAGHVADDDRDAQALGLTKTPTFFVNGLIYEGPIEAADMIAALEETRPETPAAPREAGATT